MSDNPRVILIGLDGATWDLIKPWAMEGKLPAFKKLMREGAQGVLKSTIPPLSPAAWTSVFTGVTPLKHGIWSFVKRKKDSYFIRPISSRDVQVPHIWKILSQNGIRSVFINIPFTYPPSKFNGILITGLGTPSVNSNFSYPTTVREEILSKFPDYNVDFNEDKIMRSKDKSFIIEEIDKITEAHINAFKYFYEKEKEQARVFSVVLRSLDVIQHYFWDNKEVILKFYQQADELLDWCIKNKEDNDLLLVCSDHGFESVKRRIYINEWLKKEGFLEVSTSKMNIVQKILPSAEFFHKLLVNLGFKNIVWKIKHSKYLETLIKLFPSRDLSYMMTINWEKTEAYFLEGSGGIIQINLRNREPKGVVPKEKYDEIRENIIKKLPQLKDPKTGEIVFKFVKKGEEIYGSSRGAPDIILYQKGGYTLSGRLNRSSRIFENETERNGDHTLEGIICAYGGAINNKVLKDVAVWDVAAIVLQYIGIDIPNYFDGQTPEGLFKKDFLKKRSSYDYKEKLKIKNSIKKLIKEEKFNG